MASSHDKRTSVQLSTIPESDEDLNEVLEDVMRSSRRKKDCQTPSKKSNGEKSDSVTGSGTRRRTSRHCADQAREKITTLFNVGDKYGRSIYAVSEDGTSDDSSEASFKPIDESEVMPKGECKNFIFVNFE